MRNQWYTFDLMMYCQKPPNEIRFVLVKAVSQGKNNIRYTY